MEKLVLALFGIIVFLVVAAGISAIIGGIVMLAWNFTVVPLFGWPALTFLKAWALWFLLAMVAGLFRGSK